MITITVIIHLLRSFDNIYTKLIKDDYNYYYILDSIKIMIPDNWHYIITFINKIIMFSEEIFILNNNIKSIKSEIYVDVQATLLTLYYSCYFTFNQIYLYSMNIISRYICIHCLILFLYFAVLSALLVSSAMGTCVCLFLFIFIPDKK